MSTIGGRQVYLGVKGEENEAEAWVRLRELMAGVVREAVAAERPAVRPGTVAELVPRFLEAKTIDVAPPTLRGYRQYLDWLRKHFPENQVSALAVDAIRRAAAGEEWSDTHRHNVLWCVGAFLRWCGRTDKIPLPPKASRGADAVISEETHALVLAEVKGDFRALCEFLWHTGCRPGEATGLVAESVNWEARAVTLRKHKTRHRGKTRTLHLSGAALAVLEAQARKYGGAGLLFRGLRGRPLSLQAMTMRFQRVSEKIGRTVRSYDYRHTYATRALAAGESDTVVAGLLGHTSTAMLHRAYSHINETGRTLRDAADRIAG
jgi:integrase/recombinase XerC